MGQMVICAVGLMFILAAIYRIYKIRKMFGNGAVAMGTVVDGEYSGGVWTPVLQFKTAAGNEIRTASYVCDDGNARAEYKKIENPKETEIMYDIARPEICVLKDQYRVLHVKMAMIIVIGLIATFAGLFGF